MDNPTGMPSQLKITFRTCVVLLPCIRKHLMLDEGTCQRRVAESFKLRVFFGVQFL
jgi:hypothetical protein